MRLPNNISPFVTALVFALVPLRTVKSEDLKNYKTKTSIENRNIRGSYEFACAKGKKLQTINEDNEIRLRCVENPEESFSKDDPNSAYSPSKDNFNNTEKVNSVDKFNTSDSRSKQTNTTTKQKVVIKSPQRAASQDRQQGNQPPIQNPNVNRKMTILSNYYAGQKETETATLSKEQVFILKRQEMSADKNRGYVKNDNPENVYNTYYRQNNRSAYSNSFVKQNQQSFNRLFVGAGYAFNLGTYEQSAKLSAAGAPAAAIAQKGDYSDIGLKMAHGVPIVVGYTRVIYDNIYIGFEMGTPIPILSSFDLYYNKNKFSNPEDPTVDGWGNVAADSKYSQTPLKNLNLAGHIVAKAGVTVGEQMAIYGLLGLEIAYGQLYDSEAGNNEYQAEIVSSKFKVGNNMVIPGLLAGVGVEYLWGRFTSIRLEYNCGVFFDIDATFKPSPTVQQFLTSYSGLMVHHTFKGVLTIKVL